MTTDEQGQRGWKKRDIQIEWDKVSVRVDKWKRLQALCEELEPHEHYDGMNECQVCDESLTTTLIRQCETLLTLRAAPDWRTMSVAELAAGNASLKAYSDNLGDERQRLWWTLIGMEQAAKLIAYRGQCAVAMINADERVEEKKAYAWDALQHSIAILAEIERMKSTG